MFIYQVHNIGEYICVYIMSVNPLYVRDPRRDRFCIKFGDKVAVLFEGLLLIEHHTIASKYTSTQGSTENQCYLRTEWTP